MPARICRDRGLVLRMDARTLSDPTSHLLSCFHGPRHEMALWAPKCRFDVAPHSAASLQRVIPWDACDFDVSFKGLFAKLLEGRGHARRSLSPSQFARSAIVLSVAHGKDRTKACLQLNFLPWPGAH